MKCNCQLANRCVHAEPVDRLEFRSEGFKVMLGVSFAAIALLIWRGW